MRVLPRILIAVAFVGVWPMACVQAPSPEDTGEGDTMIDGDQMDTDGTDEGADDGIDDGTGDAVDDGADMNDDGTDMDGDGDAPGVDGSDDGTGDDGTTDDGTGDDGTTDDGTTDDAPDQTGDDAAPSARVLSGSIVGPASDGGTQRDSDEGAIYEVVAVGAESLETYRVETDIETGEFEIEIPEEETSELFIINIVAPDGQPAGPVILDSEGQEGYTGLEFTEDVDLGQIDFPEDPTLEPIVPGDDTTLDVEIDVAVDVIARLDENGVAVGVPDSGRGDEAEGETTDNPRQECDADQDGLIDMFDADDDGDGTVDDFDDDAVLNPGEADGVMVNFFMNLKVNDLDAGVYFSGDAASVDQALKTDTVITFEISGDVGLTSNIVSARIVGPPSPAPPYLPISTLQGPSPTLWSASGYALNADGPNHFQQFVVPNDLLSTGDVFTAELTFDDGTASRYSRMINYVFKNIPRLEQVGAPGALAAYVAPAEILFDGTQDLVLEWTPPVDDFAVLLTGLPYRFEVFYYDTTLMQINGIDASTWSAIPTGWDVQSQAYDVDGAALTTLSADSTFTVQLPKEIFPDTVQTSGGAVAVDSYKIDIAAQNNGNNAALMLPARKM